MDELRDDLKHIFFDMCVNQGKGGKNITTIINGKGGDLKVDGGFGRGKEGVVPANTNPPPIGFVVID